MKKWTNKIVPSFLWRLDSVLLIRHPLLWASRLHFFLYFQCFLLIFEVLITSFQKITFLNVPNQFWILIYLASANLIALTIWVYFQALMHVYRLHGYTRAWSSLNVCGIFVFCAIVFSITTIVPFLNLNRRIYHTFLEPRLPNPHAAFQNTFNLLANNTTSAVNTSLSYTDTSQSADALNYQKLYDVQKLFDSLPKSMQENIKVVLQGAKLKDFNNLQLNISSANPYLAYQYDWQSNFADTLKVFFESYSHDSIQSQKYECKVWVKKFQGRINSSRDTFISRYYFVSKVREANLIGGDNEIQPLLLSDRIKTTVKESYSHLSAENRLRMERRRYILYAEAEFFVQDSFKLIVAILHLAIMLALIIMLPHAVVHLFGPRTLFLGLVFLILLGGVFVGLMYIGPEDIFNAPFLLSTVGTLTLASLAIGAVGVPFLRNAAFRLSALQFFFYFAWLVLLMLPYYLNFVNRGHLLYFLLCMIVAVAFGSIVLRQLYWLYAQPAA